MRIREIHESFDEICNYSSILHLENNYSYSQAEQNLKTFVLFYS